MFVDRAFADTHGIRNHLDGDAVFTLFEEQLERGVENFLLTAAKFTDLTGFFVHEEESAKVGNREGCAGPWIRGDTIYPVRGIIPTERSLGNVYVNPSGT